MGSAGYEQWQVIAILLEAPGPMKSLSIGCAISALTLRCRLCTSYSSLNVIYPLVCENTLIYVYTAKQEGSLVVLQSLRTYCYQY